MSRIHWQDRVVIEPDLHHGEACIRGTRIPVAMIVGSLADGLTNDEMSLRSCCGRNASRSACSTHLDL